MMKICLKKFVISALAAIVLIITGITSINKINVINQKESSYERTSFEYVFISPSKEQINSYKTNTKAIKNIFPCYNFQIVLKGNKSSKINLLMSESFDSYDIGLFNESLLVKGKLNQEGIAMDETAAKKLNVDVGDKISFNLGGRAFELNVSAIYVASSYKGLNQGVALAVFTNEMKNAYTNELPYNLAFIDANDESECVKLINDYKPMALLKSETQYITEYKASNLKPNNLTEDEWDESILIAYNQYKSAFLNEKYESSVQIKSDYLVDVQDQTITSKQSLKNIYYIVPIFVLLAYIVLNLIVLFLNKKDDITDAREGKQRITLNLQNIISIVISTVLVSVLVFALLKIYSSTFIFTDTHTGIIWLYSLLINLSILVMIPAYLAYSNSIYKTSEIFKENKR